MNKDERIFKSGDIITLKNEIEAKIQIKTISGYEVERKDDIGILWSASIKQDHIK